MVLPMVPTTINAIAREGIWMVLHGSRPKALETLE